MKNQLEALNVYYDILKSINKIDKFCQLAPTYKWIQLFDNKYKYADLTERLKYELRNIEL